VKFHNVLKTGHQVDACYLHPEQGAIRRRRELGQVWVATKEYRQSGLQLNPTQFLGTTEDGGGYRPAEIGNLVNAVVNQEGYVMVPDQIGPFTGGTGCGEKQLAQVRGDGYCHQAGIGTTPGVSGQCGQGLIGAESLEYVIAFSSVVHCLASGSQVAQLVQQVAVSLKYLKVFVQKICRL